MNYSTIDKQNKELISILNKNEDLIKILNYLSSLKMPNYYIAAGFIFQTIWNYYDNKPLNYNLKDIDIIYYDKIHTSREYEKSLEDKITEYFKNQNLNYTFDIHNEARMPLWKKENENKLIDYYENSEEAINQWIATVQAIGVTLKRNSLKIYAPYGLSDIITKTIRPIKHKYNSKELYDKKVASWQKRFNNLNIIEW